MIKKEKKIGIFARIATESMVSQQIMKLKRIFFEKHTQQQQKR